MAKQITVLLSEVNGHAAIQACRTAEAGEYLITDDVTEPGNGDRYGLGDDYLDACDTELSRRGLELVPDHRGLRVQTREER